MRGTGWGGQRRQRRASTGSYGRGEFVFYGRVYRSSRKGVVRDRLFLTRL
jgi:hypothetical protein